MIKVMLVDDEENVINTMRRLLSWDDLDIRIVGCCSNALEALSEMTNDMPDILITDVKMPVMSGIELIQRAKEMYPLLQCVILSGYDEFALAQAAMFEGVRHYLLKPCNKKRVESVIRECVVQIEKERKRALQDSNCREILVEKITEELMEIATDKETIGAAEIQTFMESYEDVSLLKEAIVSIILKRWPADEFRKKIVAISRVYDGKEQVYEEVAQILLEFRMMVYSDESFVDKIKKYAEENYHISNLTLRHVTDQVLFMNAKYAGKQFYKKTGMKFSEYLLKIRMENAMMLLLDACDYKMYEIAERVGLGKNIQYFYQLFKKYTGMTPKEYQKINENKGRLPYES